MSANKEIIIVALGGNAITREAEESDVYHQFANTRRSLVGVADLVEKGYRVVITHGNGPQVGNNLIRVETSRHIVPPLPLGVIVADLQGGMGYMIAQTMKNKLILRGIHKEVVTILTQVVANKDDPSILNPTKFVGLPYKQEQAETLAKKRGWVLKEDIGSGWRRVVPSPIPRAIIEKEIIKKLINDDVIVIVAGGGGIPVYYESDHTLEGIDAVVDKDLTSAVLGRDIGADKLYILTTVEKIYINYRQTNQKALDYLTIEKAKCYLKDQQFPPGSMGPKVQSAIDFLEWGGKEVLITSVEKFQDALEGKTGTRITE